MHDGATVEADRFSKRPLYLQLRDALAERIATGDWKPGDAIPNESNLAREFGVSAGTMRKALDLMEAERLLTRRQGRGTFVNDQTSDKLALRFTNLRAANGRLPEGEIKVTQVAEDAAGQEECRRLQLEPRERVYRVERAWVHAGNPIMLARAIVPAARFPGLETATEAARHLTGLAQRYGVLLGKAEERLSIGRAEHAVAGALRIAPGTPVMVLDRVVYELDGHPIEWRVGWCHLADRYYRAELS
jgi:GntR family transcriptional regulator